MNDEFTNLIQTYRDKFGEGPPIWGLDDEEAIQKMKEAIESGEEMKRDDMDNLPPGMYL